MVSLNQDYKLHSGSVSWWNGLSSGTKHNHSKSLVQNHPIRYDKREKSMCCTNRIL